MAALNARTVLNIWEHGAAQPPAVRALLILCSATPDESPESLAEWSVGHRDATLLALQREMFGPVVNGLTNCRGCGEVLEVNFALDDIRVPHAVPGASFEVEVGDCSIRYRVPNSTDLLALRGERDSVVAHGLLLSRCVLGAVSPQGPVSWEELPNGVVTLIEEQMSGLDPQAEVLLDIRCATCGQVTRVPFEIDNYLWAELDRQARELLQDIHTLARVYGWSEADIVSMSEARRRAYLDLITA